MDMPYINYISAQELVVQAIWKVFMGFCSIRLKKSAKFVQNPVVVFEWRQAEKLRTPISRGV